MSGKIPVTERQYKINDHVLFNSPSFEWKGVDPPYTGQILGLYGVPPDMVYKIQHRDTEWVFNLLSSEILEVLDGPIESHLTNELLKSVDAIDSVPLNEVKKVLMSLDGDPPDTVFLAGNGGSATICDHFETEIGAVARAPFRAISLCNRAAWLTCIGNDFSFKDVFASQVSQLGKKNDLLWLFSGSGTSPNLVKAARSAKSKGMFVWSFTGAGGPVPANEHLANVSTFNITLPFDRQQDLELGFFWICHAIAYYWIDQKMSV